MRLLLKLVYLTTTLITLIVIAIPFLVLSSAPSVEKPVSIDPNKLVELKKMLSANNPLKTPHTNTIKSMRLSQQGVNQAIQLGLEQQKIHIATNVEIRKGKAFIKSSIPLATSQFYINVFAELSDAKNLLSVNSLKLGRLEIPNFFINKFFPYALQFLETKIPDATLFLSAVRDIEFQDKLLILSYEWNRNLVSKLRNTGRDLVLPEAERERIQFYYDNISKISRLLF
ncbi:MAG: hypothetical protein R3240_03960, partial [Gammaproteobacteria bacterium]|nr:hypothetical protein [Gammaproteobacteria bacterium]